MENNTRGRKLIILGLGWAVTDAEFKEFLEKFGEVEDAVVMKDGSGASRGFGFATFVNQDAAQFLLSEHALRGPLVISGKRIDPKLALPRGEVTPVQKPNYRMTAPSSAFPLRTTRIFVGRLLPTVTLNELRSYFERFGEVVDCYMPVNYATRQPRGIGFLTFASEEIVDYLMQYSHEIAGKQIAVDRAEPKKEEIGHFAPQSHLPPQHMMMGGQHHASMPQYGGWGYAQNAAPMAYQQHPPSYQAGPYQTSGGLGPMQNPRLRQIYQPY